MKLIIPRKTHTKTGIEKVARRIHPPKIEISVTDWRWNWVHHRITLPQRWYDSLSGLPQWKKIARRPSYREREQQVLNILGQGSRKYKRSYLLAFYPLEASHDRLENSTDRILLSEVTQRTKCLGTARKYPFRLRLCRLSVRFLLLPLYNFLDSSGSWLLQSLGESLTGRMFHTGCIMFAMINNPACMKQSAGRVVNHEHGTWIGRTRKPNGASAGDLKRKTAATKHENW